jgi:hypothetical protein
MKLKKDWIYLGLGLAILFFVVKKGPVKPPLRKAPLKIPGGS